MVKLRFSLLIFLVYFLSNSCNKGLVYGNFKVSKPTKKEIYKKYDLELLSKDSTVESIFNGSVKEIYNILGEQYLSLSKDSLTYVFSNFSKIDVSRSDSVIRGQKIGLAQFSSQEGKYLLKLQIYSKGKSLHYNNILRVLQNRSINENLVFKSKE